MKPIGLILLMSFLIYAIACFIRQKKESKEPRYFREWDEGGVRYFGFYTDAEFRRINRSQKNFKT
jgi:hypothetical protein